MADNGIVTVASNHSVKETIDRLAAAVTAKGIAVFARIDHASGAASVAMNLRPTELLVFGNPKAGTPLMQGDQRAGIDLPLKALAWQDADGKVWLSTDDPHWLARRHGLAESVAPAVDNLAKILAGLIKAAAD
jgi:uncharacterized protein (DUF302 family)